MDNKKKILLGENDILSRDNEDLFINLNLNSTFTEIRNDKYENVFDVDKQWKKERNASRDFRIYGIVDSTLVDCDNQTIYAYDSAYPGAGINSGTTQVSGLVMSINTTAMVYDGINSYGKKRGKYLLELTGYTKDFIYLKIPSNNFNYKDQIFPQQLIFRDVDGSFVEYGTQTIDISDTGETIEINNDFYFLYNKHWVKKDLSIIEEKPATISFSATPLNQTVSETALFSVGTTYSVFSVVLDKPSSFGLESAVLSVSTTTLDPFTEIGVLDSNFIFQTLPVTVNFALGEQIKNYYFVSPEDSLQEFLEDVTFELSNFSLVNTGSPLEHTFFVTDTTPRNRAIFNFQNIYENRNYFTGIIKGNGTAPNQLFYSYPMPAVLRNGLKFEGTPMEFYPIDNFTLTIKNIGTNTILPVNPILGVASEQIFLAGQSLTFNIQPQYQNTERHSIKFYFSNLNNTSNVFSPYLYSFNNGITINGIPVVDYYQNYKVDYEKFLACLKNTTVPSTGFNISGWKRYPGMNIPFDVEENLTALTITITAKSPGTRLDITPYSYSGGNLTAGTLFENIFNANSASLVTLGMTAETIQEFVYSAQTPVEILLGANIGNNLQAQYEFFIQKVGYDGMNFSSSPVNAAITPSTYYLSSGYHDILRNWNNSTNQIVYNNEGVTSNWYSTNYITNGFYKTGEAYINGIVLLANTYFDNTQNTGTYLYGGSINLSHFTNASGDYRADFLPTPITVIPETNEYFSVNNVSQIGYLRILNPNFGVSVSPPSNIIASRSFDFRTGSTGAYNTYYTSSYNNYNASSIQFQSSGGTIGTTNTLSYNTTKVYLETGKVSPLITDQGVYANAPISYADYAEATILSNGTSPLTHVDGPVYNSYIKLESKTGGVPFYINNVIEMRYIYGLADYTKNSINYYEARPNQIAGVTINLANNHMGGYSLTRP